VGDEEELSEQGRGKMGVDGQVNEMLTSKPWARGE
jgi:hypothetical protein